MSDDSGDLSDIVDPRPSGSKCRTRSDHNQKKNRRIVMRIEFDDSDEETTSASCSSGGEEDEEQPSCSTKTNNNNRRRSGRFANAINADDTHDDSDQFNRNASSIKRRQNRRPNVLALDGSSSSDGTSSGSEIMERVKTRGKTSKKVLFSDDERDAQSPPKQSQTQIVKQDDNGFSSDSSSNELLEKCPICLLTFRKQEIGSPATCNHIFCANCIEAWSKNVQTCPIDRIEFEKIIVRESFENRKIVREICVDKNKAGKELEVDDDIIIVEEDVTNCEICNSPEREDVMLLCDSCNQGYHIDCLTPALDEIPEGSWYCDNCFDSQDEDEDDEIEEDLSMLYEDIRDMGIPESRLRVTEVHQPRILRTRQNERIRADILRRMRTRNSAALTTTTTTTTTTTSRGVGRPRKNPNATTTTTTTRRTATTATTKRKPQRRRRRRRARQRTYVVEYDLNNFDEKFAIKTTKKVIRRRKRKRRTVRRSRTCKSVGTDGRRLTASQRLAEQMGVKREQSFVNQSHLAGAHSGLSLFGNANDLEYFSDSDQDAGGGGGGLESEIHIETGHGTAVQTSVRISNFGSHRSQKSLLFGRLNRSTAAIAAANVPTNSGTPDILSNILDMQDRWHTASRNLENVHINADGTLNLNKTEKKSENNTPTTAETQQQTVNSSDVTQAPMYPQGGRNQNFNNSSGGYNSNNQQNYRSGGGGGGSGGGNQYRHSTGGSGTGLTPNFNMVGRGNFSFSNPDYNSNQNQSMNFSSFNDRERDRDRERERDRDRDRDRFNQRNRQQQNNNSNNNNNNNMNQRHSLPFNNIQQQQPLQQPPPLQPPLLQPPHPHLQQLPLLHPPPQLLLSGPPHLQSQQPTVPPPPQLPLLNSSMDNQLFGGLPPPLHLQQQQQQQNEPQLFSGLPPPPIFEPHLTIGPQLPQSQHLPDLSIPPPMVMTVQSHIVPPPPPAPPAALASWNSTLLSYAQDDDDDDSNCPNFSVYSAESQEVAKASETKTAANDGQKPKEDDENEDLVQLDDDDDIPIPADNINTSQHQNSDLYEPENPTEEPENESETEIEPEQTKTSDSSPILIIGPKNKPAEKVIDTEIENENEGNNEYDPEHETDTIPSNDDDEIELNENNNKNETNEKVDTTDKNFAKKKNDKDEIEKSDKVTVNRENQEKTTTSDIAKKSEDARSLSPTLSDAKIPDAANRKGVLELYDDSDWDELDIDRPKSRERIEGEKLTDENKTEEADKVATEEDTNVENEKEEADRSYTPCLDEKNDLEEGALPSDEENDGAAANDEGNTPVIEPTTSDANNVEKIADKIEKTDANKEVGIGGLETELISDDEENDRRINNRRRNDKRNKREAETFKKVSHKRKERNYRVEKVGKRYNRRRSSMSRSKSRSRSRSLTRSPTRSRSKSPKSRRNRKRKSRTPHRSRSRSNDKENVHGGRFRFGFFNNRRFQRPLRPKRRELPRYDVRNVVGQQRNFKDRYGRDTSRPPRYSRSVSPARRRKSLSRSRSRSLSPKRNRRNSFSMSPSPPGVFNRRSPPRRSPSPRLRRSHSPQRRMPSPTRLRSRSLSPIHRMNGRKVIRRIRNVASPVLPRSGSMTPSPRYTPRLSRSPSPSLSPKLRKKGKKKPIKDRKKKKINRKRVASKSPEPMRRLSRQRDPYINDLMLAPPKRKRHRSPQQAKAVQSPHMEEPTWSPSPSPPPIREYDNNNVSWTPPLVSPTGEFAEMHFPNERPTGSKAAAKKDKRKREKKKKTKIEKRRDGIRKEKRRQRRTETPEPLPSKEVFASGNNILVSVSFNKEAATQPQQQTTVVTLPPTREEVVSSLRRASADRQVSTGNVAKKKKEKSHKRKKLDAKPVAIIDLERSPFQVHQEPADVIVLTDSEGGQDDDVSERREHRDHLMSDSGAENLVHHHRTQAANVTSGGRSGSHQEKTPPLLETIMEESYEIQQTGPKTPPEPPTTIKFTLLAKKQNKQRNPLHEEPELNGIEDMEDEQDQQHQHRQEMESAMHMQNNQKIGPNTPPESGPCSPDVYDPFDPTKSPSMSPRSPTPPPLIDGGGSQNTMGDKVAEAQAQKHISDEPRLSGERIGQQQSAVGSLGGGATQGTSTLNPVELVMALMNSKQQNNSQDISNKSIESQYSTSSSHMHTVSSAGAGHDESHGVSGMHDKSDEGISTGGGAGITVLSNVLISTAKSQHIPTISSPTPIPKGSQNLISKLPLPKIVSGSVGSGSGIGIPSGNSNLRNGGGGADDSFNDLESPYSPGSADYEDLFEPPPDTHNSKRRSRRGGNKTEQFDNLFGSSSPVGQMRLPSYTPSNKKRKMAAAGRKSKLVKVAKSGDDHIKVYDDVPNSAVELQVKDKFIAKLNRQERVVEEVKHILKPRFNKKQITKDDYKEIMRRAVPKICHSRSGEINPNKIKNLIEAYVKKFRAKHKKLNIINTGQVSSAVKCAAYLKKLKE